MAPFGIDLTGTGGKEGTVPEDDYIIPLKDIYSTPDDIDAPELDPTSLSAKTTPQQEGEDPKQLHAVKFDRELPIFVLGKTGSGKTSLVNALAQQLNPSADDAVVIFDYKNDYKDYGLYDLQDDIVLSKGTNYNNTTWNVFTEINSEQDYGTVADLVFPEIKSDIGDREDKWWGTARDMFEGALRVTANRVDSPTNAELKRVATAADRLGNVDDGPGEALYRIFDNSSDPEVNRKSQQIAPNTEAGRNVYQGLSSRVDKVFEGPFANSPRGETGFSIRQYMNQPDGQRLVISMGEGKSGDDILQVLLDFAIYYGRESDNEAYFILDEIDGLEPLQQLKPLITKGRGEGARGIVSIQSVSQLENRYNESIKTTVCDACPQQVLMQTDDTDYVLSRMGKVQKRHKESGSEFQDAVSLGQFTRGKWSAIAGMGIAAWKRKKNDPEINIETVDPIEPAKIQYGSTGQAVVSKTDGWIFGRTAMWQDLPDELQSRFGGSSSNTPTGQSRSPSSNPPTNDSTGGVGQSHAQAGTQPQSGPDADGSGPKLRPGEGPRAESPASSQHQGPDNGTGRPRGAGSSKSSSLPQEIRDICPIEDADETVTLRMKDWTFDVPLDTPVGGILREIHIETGGSKEDALRVHREHIQFERHPTADILLLTAVGDQSPTVLDGELVEPGYSGLVSEGDTITLGDEVRLTVWKDPTGA